MQLKGVKDPKSATFLSSSAEQEFLQEFVGKIEADSSIDSDDDVLLKNLPVCANYLLALGPGHI